MIVPVEQMLSFPIITGENLDYKILVTDALTGLRSLPSGSVHCVVTSIPYWGLRMYDVQPITFSDGWHGHLGLEPTLKMFVTHIVEIFEELKRVLHKTATCWVNIGNSYAQNNKREDDEGRAKNLLRVIEKGYTQAPPRNWDRAANTVNKIDKLKAKDMTGQHWAVAFALRDAGWYLRSEIIWEKVNCMPSSVTDRPCTSHETIFLLSKSEKYYYDRIAIQEPIKQSTIGRNKRAVGNTKYLTGAPGQSSQGLHKPRKQAAPGGGMLRNKRTVWSISNKSFKGAHFATFPLEIPEIAIKAGTSERGCCNVCLTPWKRVLKATEDYKTHLGKSLHNHENDLLEGMHQKKNSSFKSNLVANYVTLDWIAGCKCAPNDKPLVKPVVLDPFVGSGTTIIAGLEQNCVAIGIELSENYARMAKERIEAETFKRKKTKKHKSSKLARSLQLSLFETE